MPRNVYIVGAYIPNGGTFMAYNLGKILHKDFGLTCFAVTVGNESYDHEIFDYNPNFPSITIEEMVRSISDDDILIANPSFSSFNFGLRCRGLKIMYIQGFTTFSLLDCNFDHYVTVSEFVRNFISNVYGIETTVIPAFIQSGSFPASPQWIDRPAKTIIYSQKGDGFQQQIFLDQIKQSLNAYIPGINFLNLLDGEKISQRELMQRIGRYRYFLTLSLAEGFGLLPLEAMYLGSTVLGFDGFGGRDYMRSGSNCLVSNYPNIKKLTEQIAIAIENCNYAETLAEAGQATASQPIYTYEHFRMAWHEQFAMIFDSRR